MPHQVIIYSDIQLFCAVDLENDTLYSLKWFLNETEVGSFIPSKNESSIQFLSILQEDDTNTTEGPSHVNETSSILSFDETSWMSLSLHSVSWKSEGLWSCEVSADQTFQRDRAEQVVSIIGMSKDPPKLF